MTLQHTTTNKNQGTGTSVDYCCGFRPPSVPPARGEVEFPAQRDNSVKIRIMLTKLGCLQPAGRPEMNFRAIKQHPINRVNRCSRAGLIRRCFIARRLIVGAGHNNRLRLILLNLFSLKPQHTTTNKNHPPYSLLPTPYSQQEVSNATK